MESLKVLIADSVAKILIIVKTGASTEGFVENCFYDGFYSPYGGCGENFWKNVMSGLQEVT